MKILKIPIPGDICLRPQQRKTIETEIIIPAGYFGILFSEPNLLAQRGLLIITGLLKEEEKICFEVMNLNQSPTNTLASFTGDKNIYLRKDEEIATVLLIS